MYYVFWRVHALYTAIRKQVVTRPKGAYNTKVFHFFFVVSSSVVALVLKFYQRVAIFQWVLETGGTYTKPSCCILYIIRKDTTQKLLKRIIALRYPVTNAYNWVCRINVSIYENNAPKKRTTILRQSMGI